MPSKAIWDPIALISRFDSAAVLLDRFYTYGFGFTFLVAPVLTTSSCA